MGPDHGGGRQQRTLKHHVYVERRVGQLLFFPLAILLRWENPPWTHLVPLSLHGKGAQESGLSRRLFFCLDCDQRHVRNGGRCHLLLPTGERLSSPKQSGSRVQSCSMPCANHHEASASTSVAHRNTAREEEHCPRCTGTSINLTLNVKWIRFFTGYLLNLSCTKHSLGKVPPLKRLPYWPWVNHSLVQVSQLLP